MKGLVSPTMKRILATGVAALALFLAVPATASPGQDNAVRKAQTYLSIQGFSRTGLIKQLEYDQYSEDDATAAVDSLTVDWNANAAEKGKTYLGIQGFSHDGLVKQLEYDGFTSSQAEYGADGAGA